MSKRTDECRDRLARAELDPGGEAAREDLLWVARRAARGSREEGAFYTRSHELLLEHHGGHAEVARLALVYAKESTPERETFLRSLVAAARGPEAEGHARLGLATFLQSLEIHILDYVRHFGDQSVDALPLEGEPLTLSRWDSFHPKYVGRDLTALREEAEALFRDVIANYGDVPYRSSDQVVLLEHFRELLTAPEPTLWGRPISVEEIQEHIDWYEDRPTLAEVAFGRLYESTHLRIGLPAPAIDRTGLDGTPLRLGDYLGKVVVLYFWAGDVESCIRSVPDYLGLLRRFEGRPFAILGISLDDGDEQVRATVAAHGMAWPHWNDLDGTIEELYRINRWPVEFLIDHRGRLRGQFKCLCNFENLLEPLVAEAESGW